MSETEESFDEENLTEAEKAEHISSPEFAEQEPPEHDTDETGANKDRESLDPGLRAVLEQKGGETDDWALEYRGDSGYHFDGDQVRDPEGNVWTNEDAALHQEMLAQWREGGSGIFFLPDHHEQREDGETMYVTMMMLGEKGEVTYEIHKHETRYQKEEEEPEKPEERTEPSIMSRSEMAEKQEIDGAERPEEIALAIEATAFADIQTPETVEVIDEARSENTAGSAAEARLENQPEAIAEEIATAADASANEHQDGPDPWLVELLNFDKLEVEETRDETPVETAVQEPVQGEAGPDVLREVLTEPAVIQNEPIDDASGVEQVSQPHMPIETPHNTAEKDIDRPVTNESNVAELHKKAVAEAVEVTQTSAHERSADIAQTPTVTGNESVVAATETPASEQSSREVMSGQEVVNTNAQTVTEPVETSRTIATEHAPLVAARVVSAEATRVERNEPSVALTQAPAESTSVREPVPAAARATDVEPRAMRETLERSSVKQVEHEPTHPMTAEIVLRALGLPVPVRDLSRDPESMRMRIASGVRAASSPLLSDRAANPKDNRAGRSRSRDGVILEMVV